MTKFYAVANGRNTGVFSSWDECKRQVEGFSNARFKSFSNANDARQFANGSTTSPSIRSGKSAKVLERSETPYSYYIPSSERAQRNAPEPLRSAASKSRNHGIPQPVSQDTKVVYTDGSALGNGKKTAKAGWGVWWGPEDPRNCCGRVDSGAQTNNRGELMAIRQAVDQIKTDRPRSQESRFEIRADSQYSIDAITKWGDNWEKNGWKTSVGGAVENKDLIKSCRNKIKSLKEEGVKLDLVYVRGHAGHEGNVAADLLARQGADPSCD